MRSIPTISEEITFLKGILKGDYDVNAIDDCDIEKIIEYLEQYLNIIRTVEVICNDK